MKTKTKRLIAIKHRVKFTADKEERPTLVAIKDGEEVVCHGLKTETDELDFLLCRFPIQHRLPTPDDEIEKILPRHLRWRNVKTDEKHTDFPEDFVREEKKKWQVAEVPVAFDGLKEGDTVLMTYGGSGDRFAFALSRRGDDIGARVLRVPPAHLKRIREMDEEQTDDKKKTVSKSNDHKLLIELFVQKREFFYPVLPRSRKYIRVAEAFRARMIAMKERIACEQRLRQRMIGSIFLDEDGHYPEGRIEDLFDSMKASDELLKNLIEEEKQLEKEFQKAVRELEIWKLVMKELKGFGERIAAGIITGVVDISRFMVDKGEAKFVKFCGVHVRDDGTFPRNITGKQGNWNPSVRQSFYLFADQCNRRPKSEWGKKLLENKARLRKRHPEPEQAMNQKGKMVSRYTDGHILKMAKWRTMNQFARWLFKKWAAIEQRNREADKDR